jgi:hypothetical protein
VSNALASEAAQAMLRADDDRLAARTRSDLTAVLSTPEGRRFVWDLLDDKAGTFGPSFVGEPHATSYNEGRRSVGLGLLVRCQQYAPDLYVQALQEQLAEARARQATQDAAEVAAQESNTHE